MNTDFNMVNKLKEEIEMSKEKKVYLENEEKNLNKIKLKHDECKKEKKDMEDKIDKLEKELNDIRKKNNEKKKEKRKKLGLTMKENNINFGIDEKLPEEEKDKIRKDRFQNRLDIFMKKNEKLLYTSNSTGDLNEEKKSKEKNKKKIFVDEVILSKIKKEQQLKNKLNYAKNIRNNNILSLPNDKKEETKYKNDKNSNNDKSDKNNNEKNNMNELPIIPLFNQSEKKALLNILPEKEIQKYEKRFQYIDKEKNNLIRKNAVETKKLKQKKEEIENNYKLSFDKLEKNKNDYKKLEFEIKKQEKKLKDLEKTLNEKKKYLADKRNEVKNIEEDNRKLLKKLQNIQNNVEEIEENDEEEEKEEKDEEGNEEQGNE